MSLMLWALLASLLLVLAGSVLSATLTGICSILAHHPPPHQPPPLHKHTHCLLLTHDITRSLKSTGLPGQTQICGGGGCRKEVGQQDSPWTGSQVCVYMCVCVTTLYTGLLNLCLTRTLTSLRQPTKQAQTSTSSVCTWSAFGILGLQSWQPWSVLECFSHKLHHSCLNTCL